MVDRFRIIPALAALLFALQASHAAATEVRFVVNGLGESGTETLRNASILLQTAETEDATTQDLIAAARAEYARQVGALYQRGFYSSVVNVKVDGREAADISPLATPDTIREIVVTVETGPPFVFDTARVSPLTRNTQLPEGFRTGERAQSGLVGQAAQMGVQGWRNRGHAKAEIAEEDIFADHRAATLSADITLRPGPRLTFGDLKVAGTERVRPERIRAIAGLPTGETFSSEKLTLAGTRLRRTGAFSSVAMQEAEVPGPDGTLDITATVAEERRRRIGAGAEIATQEGLTLTAFWMHRNLFGGAERLRFDAEVSGIGGDSGGTDYLASVRFDRPATFNPETGFYLGASAEQIDDPNLFERNFSIGGGLTHVFSDRLEGELGIGYQYTDLDDAFGKRTLEHLFLPGRLTFDDRDNELSARDGVYLDFSVTPFVGLRGESPGTHMYLDARTYRSVGSNDGVVLAARAQFGSLFGAPANEVPSDLLFFSGGASTVRGQEFESLGVELPNGNLVGGRSFVGLSGEVRTNVSGPWSVVAFADYGYVGSDSLGGSDGDWHAGGGLGVRYDTGIGPIRVDVATPIGDDAGENLELYIGIGQAF